MNTNINNTEYIDMEGTIVPSSSLKSERARELANILESGLVSYATMIECRIDDKNYIDIVIFDIRVGLAQIQVCDIRDTERIACVFSHNDSCIPLVYALRNDFPLTGHMHQMEKEYPRCLCIYEENYDDLKIVWTTSELLMRIEIWLSKTSTGTLHGADQPLELLLYSSRHSLVLPPKYEEIKQYKFAEILSPSGEKTYVEAREDKYQNGKLYITRILESSPIEQRVIRKLPLNLYELSQFLREAGIDVVKEISELCKLCEAELREKFAGETQVEKVRKALEENKFILVVVLRQTRAPGKHVEQEDVRAFILDASIMKAGIELKVWEDRVKDYLPGKLIPKFENPAIDEKMGENIPIVSLNVHRTLTRELAAHVNGYNVKDKNENIVMVGAGALGSNLINNLARTGFGKWTVIDHDNVVPHNLGRHILNAGSIGHNKAIMTALHIYNIFNENIVEPIPINILRLSYYEEHIKESTEKALINADMIIDVSTSIAVERFLALDLPSKARRVSAFFNPRGTDLVMLVEDKERTCTLDFLEMQYYRSIVNTAELKDHIKVEPGKIRYATSCREVSSRIPQDYVGMLSSVCSAKIHRVADEDNSGIYIWQINTETLEIKYHDIKVYGRAQMIQQNKWTIVVDEWVTEKIKKLREEKLPRETGGVLIGSYDMQRKIIYVVDTVPSPPDSDEQPTSYIRGCAGLAGKVEAIKTTTQGKLTYIGEWHSHPHLCGDNPSPYDVKLLEWISNAMKLDGHPGLMIICSDTGLRIFVQ